MKKFIYIILSFVVIGSLIYYITGCNLINDEKKDPDTGNFKTKIEMHVLDALIKASFSKISIYSKVSKSNMDAIASEIISEMVFLKGDTVRKVKDGSLPVGYIDSLAKTFIAFGLLVEGDYAVKAEWKSTKGVDFFTLGVMNSDGKPKFEPIVYFTGIESSNLPSPVKGSWTWGPWKRTIKNGFDADCVEVEWTVKVKTSDDGCKITDPGPHIEITKAISNCWGWSQITTKGETPFCSDYPDCQCSGPVPGNINKEDCIKWVVVTYVATGASNIKVEGNAGGEYQGIKVDTKVSFDVSRFGSEGTFETIRNLCAKTGGS